MKKKFKLTGVCLLMLLVGCLKNPEKIQPSTTETITEIPSTAALKKVLQQKGFGIFDYVDEKTGDTILMQQYFIAFLKRGDRRSQSKEELDSLQKLHLEHLGRMYQDGYADISGPFGDDGDIRGITIYNVPTLEMADSLASADPMVKAEDSKSKSIPGGQPRGFPYDKKPHNLHITMITILAPLK